MEELEELEEPIKSEEAKSISRNSIEIWEINLYYHFDYTQSLKRISNHFYYFLEKRDTRSLLALSVSRRLRFGEPLSRFWEHFFVTCCMGCISKNVKKHFAFEGFLLCSLFAKMPPKCSRNLRRRETESASTLRISRFSRK